MDEAIQKSLEQLHYKEVRPNQNTVIKEYLKGNDVLFCSPTGSGKSLTFEIAPFVFNNFSINAGNSAVIVVSPFVALMQHQVETLVHRGVSAVYLQDIYSDNAEFSLDDLNHGKASIIFGSPESLLGEHRSLLINMTSNGVLKAIFIDEAHCIVKFGKGDKKRKIPAYRPHYGKLGELRSLVEKTVPIIALTATATEDTRETIMKDLCMMNCTQIVVNPEKHNVKYSVENVGTDISSDFMWLHDLILTLGKDCPRIIVFFRQIKQISEVFEYLQTNLCDKQYVECQESDKNGYWNRLFAMFHLTTNEKIKKCICSSFLVEAGKIRVVLCSTSFSMGLYVKNVHTVVHYSPANDLDDYLQETGRAGRDESTRCNAVLLAYKRSTCSQNISPAMKQYVRATSCRRLLLLQPFWNKVQSRMPMHSCCDVCAAKCRCACGCADTVCTCSTSCSATESHILGIIRKTITAQNQTHSSSESSEYEGFSSDSDIEEFIRRKPRLVFTSESDS